MPPRRLIINSCAIFTLNRDVEGISDHEVSRKELMLVWNKLDQDEAAAFFRHPNDATVAPRYGKGVKHRTSMDLRTIGQKIEEGIYKQLAEFLDDCHLMFEHVYHYYSNRSTIYKQALNLQRIFEEAVQPLVHRYGYCCSKKLYYTPVNFSCYQKKECTISPGKYFYYHQFLSGDIPEYYFLCSNCYNKLPSEGLDISQTNEDGSMLIPKTGFVKAYNPLQNPERFVFCVYCKKRLHEVCVQHYSDISGNFVCRDCSQFFVQHPEDFSPLELPQHHVANFLQLSVNAKMKTHSGWTDDDAIYFRLVTNAEKTVELQPLIKELYSQLELPEVIPYKLKVILVFQIRNGDPVFFFALNVQEYYQDNPPNRRTVYIAYLDSVKVFQPSSLRSTAYHEILLSYLEYCKLAKFETAYIWACPPNPGVDYVFNCHPPEQKTPGKKLLRSWYASMLDKAVSRKVIQKYGNILEKVTSDGIESPHELPYFEGDCWPDIIETSIEKAKKELETGIPEDKNHKSNKKTGLKTLPEDFGNPMAKLLKEIKKNQDNYLYVQIQAETEVPIVDRSKTFTCNFIDSRETFLTYCRCRNWEFSTLRHVAYSTKCISFHLHQLAPQFVCDICGSSRISWQCNDENCPDFDLCNDCYVRQGHCHELLMSTNISYRDFVKGFNHARTCSRVNGCRFHLCASIKKQARHCLDCLRCGSCEVFIEMKRRLDFTNRVRRHEDEEVTSGCKRIRRDSSR